MNDGAERHLTALYKEYDTLRAEVLLRVRARFELLGLFVAGATLVLARKSPWLLVPFGLGLAGIWLYLGWAISRCSSRLAEIEDQVNAVVGDGAGAGGQPMQWESRLRGSRFNRFGLHR